MTDVKIKDLTKKEIDGICNNQPDDGCNSCPLNIFGVCFKRTYAWIHKKSIPVARIVKDDDEDEDEDIDEDEED